MQGQVLVNGKKIEEADIAAKNGRIYTLSGVLIPPSIIPILPQRCDKEKYELKLVRFFCPIKFIIVSNQYLFPFLPSFS